jgi:hypothetical protein
MLPNLIIIGAMKSGTTSLCYYLDQHPEIAMAEGKELDFFIDEKNWGRGLSWYESYFNRDANILGEASPNYSKYPMFSGVPERMFPILKDAKLIYVLRDPIERIVSHYIHSYSKGRENRTIAGALKQFEGNNYICSSMYYMQLERYLKYYDDSAILLVSAEDLRDNRRDTLRRTFRFLGVDESFYCDEYAHIIHDSSGKRRNNQLGYFLLAVSRSGRVRPFVPRIVDRLIALYNARTSVKIERPVLPEALKQKLIDYLKDDIARLREHTGNSFASWCL